MIIIIFIFIIIIILFIFFYYYFILFFNFHSTFPFKVLFSFSRLFFPTDVTSFPVETSTENTPPRSYEQGVRGSWMNIKKKQITTNKGINEY